jgi:prophage regulatory protein
MPTPKVPGSFLKLKQVLQKTGLSRSAIYAQMATGEFPSSVRLSKRSVGWIDFEIQDWIDDRVREARDGLK